MAEQKDYFFRRHPGITMLAFVTVITLGLLKVADVILWKRAERINAELEKSRQEEPVSIFGPQKRVVRMREIRAELSGFVQPTKEYLESTENLADKRYFIHTDKDAFIAVPGETQNPEGLVVFLGGSTTECLYVTEDKRFPAATGAKISSLSGKKVVGKNGGVSGNHSMHANNLLLNKVVPLKPKVVVLMESVNDLNVLLYEKTYWNTNINRSLVLDSAMTAAYNGQFPQPKAKAGGGLLSKCFPYIAMRVENLKAKAATGNKAAVNEWQNVDSAGVAINSAILEADFANSLRTFIGICRAWGITPVLMTQQNRMTEEPGEVVLKNMAPLKKYGIKYEDYRKQYQAFNEVIRRVAKAENVKLVDLDNLVPKSPKLMYDVVHVNDEGANVISDIVSRELSIYFNE